MLTKEDVENVFEWYSHGKQPYPGVFAWDFGHEARGPVAIAAASLAQADLMRGRVTDGLQSKTLPLPHAQVAAKVDVIRYCRFRMLLAEHRIISDAPSWKFQRHITNTCCYFANLNQAGILGEEEKRLLYVYGQVPGRYS